MIYKLLLIFAFLGGIIFFAIDFSRGKPDPNPNKNFGQNFGELLVTVCITLIGGAVAIFLTKYGFIQTDERAVLIAMLVFMYPFRKMLAMWGPTLLNYLIAIDNQIAQVVEPFLVVKNMDPENGKPVRVAVGLLRLGHVAMFGVALLFTAIGGVFSGITNSRINVVIHVIQQVANQAIGDGRGRVIFLIWLSTLLVLIVLAVWYLKGLYQNTLALHQGEVEVKDYSKLRIAMILLWWGRKFFAYIFIMKMYRLQDFVFWWFVAILAGGVIFVSKMVAHMKEEAST